MPRWAAGILAAAGLTGSSPGTMTTRRRWSSKSSLIPSMSEQRSSRTLLRPQHVHVTGKPAGDGVGCRSGLEAALTEPAG